MNECGLEKIMASKSGGVVMANAWQERIKWDGGLGGWAALGVVALFAIPAFRRGIRSLTVRAIVGAWTAGEWLRESVTEIGTNDHSINKDHRSLPNHLLPKRSDWQKSMKKWNVPTDFAIRPYNAFHQFENAVKNAGAEMKP